MKATEQYYGVLFIMVYMAVLNFYSVEPVNSSVGFNSLSILQFDKKGLKGLQGDKKTLVKKPNTRTQTVKITDTYTSCKDTTADLQGNNNSNKRKTYLPVPRKH